MIELWNVSRALGLVALLLLGVVLALGALHNTSVSRLVGQAFPRFVLVALHRNLALITVVFVALHVVTVLVTPYLPLRWFDVLVPGTAPYNPVPAALGAVALDLLLAVVISSSLRRHLSKRAWLVVHWTSYVCFPVAVAHAVANASFRGGTWWTLVVPLLASALVVAALLHRRAARRRAALPLAERGRTDPAEARRAADHATGAQPVVPADPDQARPRELEGERPARPRHGAVQETRVITRTGDHRAAGGRHAAGRDDPDGEAGADARTDTLGGPEAPTVALPPRIRRR